MNRERFYQNEKERRKWQNPEVILTDLGLKPGFTFMDVGCGDGLFAIPAARLVGKTGKVYGLDTDDQAVERLKHKALTEGLNNLVLKVGEAEKTVLCEACADIVFYGIVLHDFNNPVRVLMNAKKALKPDGRLIDLDWKKKSMELGPPVQIRFSEDRAIRLIESASFRIETVKAIGPYHYLITAKS